MSSPDICARRADQIDQIHSHGLDIASRSIFLFGRDEYIIGVSEGATELHSEPGIEYTIANQFIKNLRILEAVSKEDITVHMKTCGGIWEEGMAIYDAVKTCRCHVTIINYTHARSMSSLILQAADVRVMMPNSVFMIHLGTVDFGGTGTQFKTEYAQQRLSEATMLDIYADSLVEGEAFGAYSRARIIEWLRAKMKVHEDYYMSAEEAIELGFADRLYRTA